MAGDFTEPARHARAQRRGFESAATIEIGHAGTRSGFILRLDGVSSRGVVRDVLTRAFDIAVELPPLRVTSPGWWAIVVGIAAVEQAPTELLRVPARAMLHAVLRVERGTSMVDYRPDWPMARLSPTGPWEDLRGEAALQHGPSISEIRAYMERAGGELTAADVLSAFYVGVVQWRAPGRVGRGERIGLEHAGA